MNKVSVIVTTHNRPEEMLIRSINSIVNQTYKDIEIIVIDDSTTAFEIRNKMRSTVVSISRNIRYELNEVNMGACASRNKGIMLSKGDYVMYVDDDDELLPNNIEEKIKAFADDSIGLVYAKHYSEEGGILSPSKHKLYRGYIYNHLMINNCIGAFPLIRKNVFDKCGLFDVNLLAEQDIDMWLRISQKYKLEYVDAFLSIVHKHDGSRITTNVGKKIQGLETIITKNITYLKRHWYVYSRRLSRLSIYYSASKDKRALTTIVKAVLLCPFSIKYNLIAVKWFILSKIKKNIVVD